MSENDIIYTTPRTKLDRIVADLQKTMQRASDATTENASEWKAAKDAGVNNRALKLCLALDRMAEDKRTDFLRAFDAYRRQFFRWDAQLDMFDRPEVQDAPQAVAAVSVETVDEADDATSDPVEEVNIGASLDTALRAARDPLEQDAAPPSPADPEADEGGYCFNAGKSAAELGRERKCPYAPRSLKGKLWLKGYDSVQADQPQDEPEAETESTNVVSLSRDIPVHHQPGAA